MATRHQQCDSASSSVRHVLVAVAAITVVVSGVLVVRQPAGAVAGPTVTGISPGVGEWQTWIVITGTNFTGATTVFFGSNAAIAFSVESPTSIYAEAPLPPPQTQIQSDTFVDVQVVDATGVRSPVTTQ